MKNWRNKADVPTYGVCTVKEASNKEAKDLIAPYIHGFDNLYHGRKWVAWCGALYAEKCLIKKSRKKSVKQKNG